MFCKFCGSEIDDNSKFCVICGKELNYNNSEPVQSAQPIQNQNIPQNSAQTKVCYVGNQKLLLDEDGRVKTKLVGFNSNCAWKKAVVVTYFVLVAIVILPGVLSVTSLKEFLSYLIEFLFFMCPVEAIDSARSKIHYYYKGYIGKFFSIMVSLALHYIFLIILFYFLRWLLN